MHVVFKKTFCGPEMGIQYINKSNIGSEICIIWCHKKRSPLLRLATSRAQKSGEQKKPSAKHSGERALDRIIDRWSTRPDIVNGRRAQGPYSNILIMEGGGGGGGGEGTGVARQRFIFCTQNKS